MAELLFKELCVRCSYTKTGVMDVFREILILIYTQLPFSTHDAKVLKILEKAVANQLYDYLESNGMLEYIQSGFRIHHMVNGKWICIYR